MGVSATFDYFGAPDPEPYWSAYVETTITPDGPNAVDIEMIPVCESSSVRGLVVNAATLEPLEGVEVLGGGRRTFTDAEGRYELLDIRPARDNEPRTTRIYARKQGFFDATIDVTTYCGAQLIVENAFFRLSSDTTIVNDGTLELRDGRITIAKGFNNTNQF